MANSTRRYVVRYMETIKQGKTGDSIASLRPPSIPAMGVNGLWNVIEHAAQQRSLLNFATLEGFERNHRKQRALVVGVDISILLAAIQRLQFSMGLADIFRIFFFKLAQWSRAPLVLIFVFDGFGRPLIKRGKQVLAQPQQLVEGCKAAIEAFGYYHHQAPGEAEAELAQMNKLGFIDAVITEDSDTFVYGAVCVIRKLGPNIETNAQIFSSTRLTSAPFHLDEDGLLLFVLLTGGDYDDGVRGCGANIAHPLAKCGFGRELRHILVSFAGDQRSQELALWRDRLRAELRTNSSNLLQRKQPRLAASIMDTFPSSRVIDLYINPYTSWSFNFIGRAPQGEDWVPREPDIRALVAFAKDRLNWSGEELVKRFPTVVWPGVGFRMISSRFVMYSAPLQKFMTPYTNAHLVKLVQSSRSGLDDGRPSMQRDRIRISTENFQRIGQITSPTENESILLTVPHSILAIATNLAMQAISSNDIVEIIDSDEDSDSEEEDCDYDEEGQTASVGGEETMVTDDAGAREIIDLTESD
ncbi:flap endonuclease GEN 1 [Favolaschia claudopus]|uniref:Flap endonuclease GEN 1 n=1 Tax=Favolaschia claudopus TaxID=2862362 RepID=A0AAW0AA93_9AGAR